MRRAIATAMLAASVVMLTASAVFALIALGDPVPVTWGTQVGSVVWSLAATAHPAVGWLIVRKHPSNRVGWLFLWVGVVAGFHLSAVLYGAVATYVYPNLPFGLVAMWVGNWGFLAWIGLIITLIAPLFPEGRPIHARLWPVVGLIVVGLTAGTVNSALTPGPLLVDPRIRNPFAVDSPLVEGLGAGMFAIPLGVLLGIVSVVVRYRRGDQTTKQQLRWFSLAVVCVAVPFVYFITGGGDEGVSLPVRILQDAQNVGWSLIAIAVGVAVLRYRLYAVDVVINRAIVYTMITVLLGGTYLGAVFVLQRALAPLAGGGDIAVAASTLVVAALFGPLRRRVQTFIDRRFYRARYDAARLLESFGTRMRRQVDLDGVAGELVAAAKTAVQPSSVTVWLRRP